jgi:outer membrane protein assembly factor BamD
MRRTASASPLARSLAAALALAALGACASRNVTFTGQLKYRQTAEENYQAALEERKDENWVEAVKFLEYVRTKYPFSRFAALAELRLADLKFDQGRWVEAADAYQQFVQLRPTHEEIDYAEYRVGLSYLKDAPSDFALFPPAHEKDQRQIEKARVALQDFVQRHEKSKYLEEAKKNLVEAETRLAAHEWYVAEFYFKRERWAGAAGRYETLVERFPSSRWDPDALWKLAQAAVKIDEKHRARTALQKLIARHPDDARRAEAEKLLASLR